MEVIKRDGATVPFEKEKICQAILKAMKYGSGTVSVEIAERVADNIERELSLEKARIPIHNIESMVFSELCNQEHQSTARAYESYRAVREYQRIKNTTDEKVIGLITGANKETLNENANKRGELISTQAQLIYEEVSKDIAARQIYPAHIIEAHRDGVIHQHDMGHSLTKNTNCCLIDLNDMLQNGTVINGRMVEKPKSFRTACTIATQIIAQIASAQHGLRFCLA